MQKRVNKVLEKESWMFARLLLPGNQNQLAFSYCYVASHRKNYCCVSATALYYLINWSFLRNFEMRL